MGELGPPRDRVDGAAVDGDGEQTDQNERGGQRSVVPFLHGDSLRPAAFLIVSDHYFTFRAAGRGAKELPRLGAPVGVWYKWERDRIRSQAGQPGGDR